jgi:FkbM family methyltransferase
MTYFFNKVYLIKLRIINKLRRMLNKNSILLSSKKILNTNFKVNSRFSFIQIGANDGVSFDFLYDFVIKRKTGGIVIEPVLEYYMDLVANYKNYPEIIKINKAVHPIEKKASIYKINPTAKHKYPDWVKGIASFDPEHHKKTNIETNDIIAEEVLSDTLMNIVNDNYFQNYVDYLQIDTEGFDYEVLKMIDFSFFKPLIIKYESINLKEEVK